MIEDFARGYAAAVGWQELGDMSLQSDKEKMRDTVTNNCKK
jgi:hypothetical protein